MPAPRRPPPPATTPLAALPVLVLDLETTGLDVRRDRVVQIGALGMHGAEVTDGPRIDQRIDPGMPIPAIATRIHGLADADVAGAPTLESVAETLVDAIDGRVVVGHHIAFDLAVLRHEAARLSLAWHEPISLDVGALLGAFDPSLPDIGFETVASRLGVEVSNRHSALGDCRTTAQMWARLVALLRESGVRTLSEARALAARRGDLVRRETGAGWHAVPGTLERVAPPQRRPMRVDGYAFESRLEALMSRPPVFVAADRALRAAAREMIERRIGALLVGDPAAPPLGIVTERDLLRVAADGTRAADTATVADLMSSPVVTMRADEMLYRALARMDRVGVRHLCVVDADGVAIGIVSQRDLLAYRARAAAVLGDAVAVASSAQELAAAFGRVPELVTALAGEGLDGPGVARVVSGELRAATARAAELAAEELDGDDRGAAPAPWCVVVLGSAARDESLLGAEQDNALIHAGGPGDDDWFAALGAGIADRLDVAGVARCRGGIMAVNPQWRGSRKDWDRRLGEWLARERVDDAAGREIFFDLAPVTGDAALAQELHRDAVAAAARATPFLASLAESVCAVAPRFGLFGGLGVEAGRIDLKRDGLLPLTGLARTLALSAGSQASATGARLRDAVADGRLSEDDAEALTDLHAELMTCVLRQQVADVGDGVPPSARIVAGALSRGQRRRIVAGLRRLDDVIATLRAAIDG